MRLAVPLLVFLSVASAGDGIKPRPDAADYPAHLDAKSATVAAAVLGQDQARKIFGGDVGRRYMIIEVAVYPKPSFEVDPADFFLKAANGDMVRPDTPRDVANVWPEKDPKPERPGGTTVTAEAGAVYQSGRDPVTGQRASGVGTYEGVAVTNDPRAQAPPDPPRQDPNAYAIAAKVRDFALPEGRAHDAVAGYLYFPKPSKKAKQVELIRSRDGDSDRLTLPVGK